MPLNIVFLRPQDWSRLIAITAVKANKAKLLMDKSFFLQLRSFYSRFVFFTYGGGEP